MIPLAHRLQPEDIELKLRILSDCVENPFQDLAAGKIRLRVGGTTQAIQRAFEDLCTCEIMKRVGEGHEFRPSEEMLEEIATITSEARQEGAQARRQVVELAELGRLRDQLAVTHEEVAGILEMVPAGVLLVDRFGNLLKSNALGRQLTGLSPEGARMQVCEELGIQLDAILSREVQVELDLAQPVSVVSRPFRLEGSDAGAVIIVQDISQRKALEARVEQTREAFFSMIRHELRRPLLTVERALSPSATTAGEASRQEHLEHARAATSQLSGMVDDMLLLARLEKDPLTVCDLGPVSLCYLLSGGDLAFRDRAREAGAPLKMVPPDKDVRFRGDEGRLTQVMGNLLENALRFTPPGGEITLTGEHSGGLVTFRVADTGPGIPEEELGRVFDRFHQVTGERERPEGLGLGLAICRHIVQAHEGRIEAWNRPEGGAEFLVQIPYRDPEGPDAPQTSPRGSHGQRRE